MSLRKITISLLLLSFSIAQADTYNCTCNTKLKDASGNVISLPAQQVSGPHYGSCSIQCNTISRAKANEYFNGSTPRFNCPINPNPGEFTILGASYLTEFNPGTVNLVYRLKINCYRTLTNSIDKAPNAGWR